MKYAKAVYDIKDKTYQREKKRNRHPKFWIFILLQIWKWFFPL